VKKGTKRAINLADYRVLIDKDIEAYAAYIRRSTLQQYGATAHLEVDAFLKILERGGARMRGSLTILGYEMSGGAMDAKGKAMITQAARAIELLQAYLLVIDDMQDRSPTRRGGPSAHFALADYHRTHHLAGDPMHFGMSLATNAALVGAHAANTILANLDAPDDLRNNVVSITNRTMLVTGHGQSVDIMNEVSATTDPKDIDNVQEWKTATYTVLNPLHVGMVLAGAGCEATDGITPYAIHTGKAFQIANDIDGVFASEQQTGKSSLDDIKEGKRTYMTIYALEHAETADKNFLIQMLGNEHLTPAEFVRCQQIIQESGGLEFARKQAKAHVTAALKSLHNEAHRWSPEGVLALQNLAEQFTQ